MKNFSLRYFQGNFDLVKFSQIWIFTNLYFQIWIFTNNKFWAHCTLHYRMIFSVTVQQIQHLVAHLLTACPAKNAKKWWSPIFWENPFCCFGAKGIKIAQKQGFPFLTKIMDVYFFLLKMINGEEGIKKIIDEKYKKKVI